MKSQYQLELDGPVLGKTIVDAVRVLFFELDSSSEVHYDEDLGNGEFGSVHQVGQDSMFMPRQLLVYVRVNGLDTFRISEWALYNKVIVKTHQFNHNVFSMGHSDEEWHRQAKLFGKRLETLLNKKIAQCHGNS